jgi:hypothetical protein
MMVVKFVLGEMVDDEPPYVKMLTDRHEFIVNRLFNAMQAETDDHLVEETEELDLDIKENSYRMSAGSVEAGERIIV